MTVTEICKTHKISSSTINRRAQRLGYKKTRKKGNYKIYDFSQKDVDILIGYTSRNVVVERIKEVFVELIKTEVEVIRIETVYNVYPSKINYLEV
jgi:hypothetical protein